MENLTKAQDIVRELGEPRSVPDYSLIVFRDENGSRTPYEVLGSGEPFQPSFWDRYRYDFVGFAVSDDPALSYRFSCQAFSGGFREAEHYTLHVFLKFRVTQPRTVVDKLTSDPLRRLRDEIESVLEQTGSILPYEEIVNSPQTLENRFLGATDVHPEVGTNLEHLETFATKLGFHLVEIKIRHHPAAGDLAATRAEIDAERERRKLEATQGTERQKEQHQGELAVLKAQNKQSVRFVERATELLDASKEQLVEALRHIAVNTDSARSLRETIRQFIELREEFTARVLNLGDQNGHGYVSLGQSVGGEGSGRLMAVTTETGPVVEEIEAMQAALAGLDCRPSEIRILAGHILHLLAELSLGQASDPEQITRYVEDLRAFCASIRLTDRLTRVEQREYFQKLNDTEQMRDIFRPEDERTAGEAKND